MAGDPARLLATVAQAREAGWGVALDDVGAAPASQAVLPFVRPDLIKLDMRLLRGRTTAEAAHIVNSVRAHAERTDAVVLAEGIETIKHAREAAAAGATLGQGFLFGHPGPLPSPLPPPGDAIPLRPAQAAGATATPWEVVAATREPRLAIRTCWSRCACSWSTRAWTRPSPTCCWPASSRPTSSPRPPAAGTSSWPPGRRSPAPSATACRWPRSPGSAAPTWPPTTRCDRSGTWW